MKSMINVLDSRIWTKMRGRDKKNRGMTWEEPESDKSSGPSNTAGQMLGKIISEAFFFFFGFLLVSLPVPVGFFGKLIKILLSKCCRSLAAFPPVNILESRSHSKKFLISGFILRRCSVSKWRGRGKFPFRKWKDTLHFVEYVVNHTEPLEDDLCYENM